MLQVRVAREIRSTQGVTHPRGDCRWALPEIEWYLANRLRHIAAKDGPCTVSGEMAETPRGFGLVLRARSENSRAAVFIPRAHLGEDVTAEAVSRMFL